MNRRFLFLLFLAPVALAFALGGWASTARADNSATDWDISVSDAAPTGSDPVCPSNNDSIAQVGECPLMEGHFDIGTLGQSQSFFDMATEFLKTGPPGADLDGDTLADPSAGVSKLTLAARGATTGQVKFTLKNNVVLASILANNIDDVNGNYDTTVNGQPAVCGQSASTGSFEPLPFYLWAADKTQANFVSYLDTGGTATIPQTQEDHFSAGQNCMGTGGTPNGMPDAIDCTPSALPTIETTLGLPIANYVDRFYGIANLPIGTPPVAFIPVDVNFLYYNMVSVPTIQAYIQIAVLQYPGMPLADPTKPGYDPKPMTVLTCPPYTSNVAIYGISQDSDFSIPPDGVIDQVFPRAKVRTVTGPGTFDFLEAKSSMEDWDGDTIASNYDRCKFDPASGTAAQDSDGDTLTGLCESLGAGNGEGNNPLPGGPNIAPPWDTGQDVDGDGYLNETDNCPIVADRDLNGDTVVEYQQDTDADGVGDICEIDLASSQGWPANAYLIPGNGLGYPGSPAVGDQYTAKGPGNFIDRDNICSDPFTVGTAETAFDAGRWCAGVEPISNARATTPPKLPGPDNNPPQVLGWQYADSNDNATPDLLDLPAGGAIEYEDFSDSDLDGWTDACEAFMGSDPLDPASTSATPETGSECANHVDDDGDTLVNDGCPASGAPEAGAQCANATDDDGDTVVNDGCPVGPLVAGDCDGDTIPDASDFNQFTGMNPDADRDGCARSEETAGAASPKPGSTAAASNAGLVAYQDSAWYDFYDVPVSALWIDPTGTYDRAVTMGDVLAVLFYVGARLSPPSAIYVADLNGNSVKDGLEYDRSPSADPNRPWDAGPPDGAITMGDVLAALAQVGLKCTLGRNF